MKEKEHTILQALLRSIALSGDGKTPETAWFTVDPSEESAFLGLVLAMHPKQQALVQKAGHSYDEMIGTDSAGKEFAVWFTAATSSK